MGVAVNDIKSGEYVMGAFLEKSNTIKVKAKDNIPLGHKIALSNLSTGDSVIKYGVTIGKTTKQVVPGNHVHIHNLKSGRW